MKQKILVLGKGFLGKEFERHGFEVWGRDKFNWSDSSIGYDWSSDDFDSLDGYDVIINCIGCADTRYCEETKNWLRVFSVNAGLVASLSKYCEFKGKKFVQISTGCVYDSNNTPQKETDFVSSHCKYVVSKLAAENFCSEKDLIIRPRLYFSDIEDRNNLLTKLPKFEKHLTEINSYTSTKTIVEATQALLGYNQSGVFNVAQEGYATIEQICDHLGLEPKPTLNGEELRKDQGLYLVNNILDISKLKQFYDPVSVFEEFANLQFKKNNKNEKKRPIPF